MSRDMSNIYRFKTVDQLRLLRSQKLMQLDRLRRLPMGYWVKQDIAKVTHLLKQLDAELAGRADQQELF